VPQRPVENPLTVHYDGEDEPKQDQPKKTGIVYESDDGDMQIMRIRGVEVTFDDRENEWHKRPPGGVSFSKKSLQNSKMLLPGIIGLAYWGQEPLWR
jgi:hypothetical protein